MSHSSDSGHNNVPLEIGLNGEIVEIIIIIEKIGHKDDVPSTESTAETFLPIIIDTRMMATGPKVRIITADMIMGTETQNVENCFQGSQGIIMEHVIKLMVGVAALGMQPPTNIHPTPLWMIQGWEA